MKIAIIGAGLSGCNAYNILLKIQNVQISIFDKSRGTGGRLSTKYIQDKFIDHGTASIQAKKLELKNFLDLKTKENFLVKKEEYIPTKGINKVCSSLINKTDLITNSKIEQLEYINNKWVIKDQNKTYLDYNFIILTIPTKQILELDIKLSEQIKEKLQKVSYKSIASLICHSESNKKLDLSKLKTNNIFYKVVDNSNKYNYKDFSSYVLHFDNTFIEKYKELNKDDLFEVLYKKIHSEFNLNIKDEFNTIEHYWKYAFVNRNIDEEFLFDETNSIGFCGDYFINKNIQSSLSSSTKLSKKIKELLC